MLPVPADKFVPAFYKRDATLKAFTDKLDKWNAQWRDDVLSFNTYFDPVQCPSDLLIELGNLVAAGILPLDTDDQKRKKIATAIQRQKNAGEWVADIKPRIDAITGLNTQLYKITGDDDFIFTGDGLIPAGYYYSALGADGADLNLGPLLLTDGTEVQIPGNIYIDFTANITADQLAAVELIFIEGDFLPAYLVIYLGYVLSGVFNVLAVI